MASLSKIMTKGKALYLAYDQGLEHGPVDFNDKNVDPQYIIDIANRTKLNGVIYQKGIAEKYKNGKTPLIIKLNGKTSLVRGDPVSRQLCEVKEAIKLGARAVGYTIYVGSKHENIMFREFEKIEREAHKKNIPVILWAYPRGEGVKNPLNKDILAYSARVALELGADMAKLSYNGKIEDLKWVVKSAGRCKVVIAGGTKKSEDNFYKDVKDIMKTGATGIAVGRNVWQSKTPDRVIEKLNKIIWS
jgi:fructose-bisphosphate aldolase, class I